MTDRAQHNWTIHQNKLLHNIQHNNIIDERKQAKIKTFKFLMTIHVFQKFNWNIFFLVRCQN